MVAALITESWLLLKGKRDSWFYDSPLNSVGHEQVSYLAVPKLLQIGRLTSFWLRPHQTAALRNYLARPSHPGMSEQGKKDIALLKGTDTSTPTVIVSSTLRRAVVLSLIHI